MPLQRQPYQSWTIENVQASVLAIAEQYKNSYKGSIGDPANTTVDVEKAFAPSHLFFTHKDLYYSNFSQINPDYVYEFLDGDDRAPFRGFYKRTEVGHMFPEIVKKEDVPQPGQPLVGKRREPVNIGQDESADIPDLHFRNAVDFRIFEYSRHFLNASDYLPFKNAIFDGLRKGNASIDRLWVDSFIANILGLGSYSPGSTLYKFFTKDDSFTPEENYSKVARGFYLKDGEIRKNLEIFNKYVKKYYVNRVPYLTNVNTHEVIGQSLDLTIPEWSKALVDRSDETKALKYIRDCFLIKDNQGKYRKVGYTLRRLSIDCLSSMIFAVINRMTTFDARNGCGHQYGVDVKDQEAYELRCDPRNLVVMMNIHDLTDMRKVLGSQPTGPFTERQDIAGTLSSFEAKGVRFHGTSGILPGMAAVLDRIGFSFVEYLNESYSQFFPGDLVDATVHHMYKKVRLFRKVAGCVIEPAAGQKFALPLAGASEHLPMLREAG